MRDSEPITAIMPEQGLLADVQGIASLKDLSPERRLLSSWKPFVERSSLIPEDWYALPLCQRVELVER